jgi:cystathionine beta-lyase/cystathionine gamma-synthase
VESAEDAVVTASGMAAISTALLSALSSGDHLMVQDSLYGGTHGFITRDLPAFGVEYDFIDADDPRSWEAKLRPRTRAIYVESMTNPLLQVADLEAVVAFARSHDLISMVDNTFPSPVNFRAPEWGFDLSLHSCTKYLNGHSDLVAGAVIGRSPLVRAVTLKLNHLGGSLDPHGCFLLHRGLKTLALRVRQQNRTALALARMLEEHPAVREVNHPGLEAHPQHERARRLFDGFGGMLSFELEGGVEAAESLMKGLRLAVVAPSLGGVETLITRPCLTSHAGMRPSARRALGISDELIRVSVGIEGEEDLLEDFRLALG